MTKQILKVDPSSLSYSNCCLAFQRTVIDGYRFKGPLKVDIEYGNAFHKFIETLYTTNNAQNAITTAVEYFDGVEKHTTRTKAHLNTGHLLQTMSEYLRQFYNKQTHLLNNYQVATDPENNPLIEKNFAIPFLETDKYEILICGTIDEIGIQHNIPIVVDWKTTSFYDKNSYFMGYKLSKQLICYLWALKKLAQLYPKSIFTDMTRNRIGATICGVFLTSSGVSFEASEIFFYSERAMIDFEIGLQEAVMKLLRPPYKEGIINEACLGMYGKGCPFIGPCSSPDERSEELLLENKYSKNPYNPLLFRK